MKRRFLIFLILIGFALVGYGQAKVLYAPKGIKIGTVKTGTSIVTVDSIVQYSTNQFKLYKGGTLLNSYNVLKVNIADTSTMLNKYARKASPTFTGTVTIPSPFTLGATSVTVTGTHLNKVPNMQVGIFNVLDYGAVGNNSTDCTVPIQNTINAAIANGGGIVYFPSGLYKVTNTLYINNASGITVLGQGDGLDNYATQIRFTGTSKNLFIIGDPTLVNYRNSFYMTDIGLYGVSGSYNAVKIYQVSHFNIKNLAVSGFDSCGIFIHQTCGSNIENFYAHTYVGAYGWGIYIAPSSPQTSCLNIMNPRCVGGTHDGIYAKTCQQVNIYGGESSENDGYGIRYDTNTELSNIEGIDCERNTLGDYRIDGFGNTLLNCFSFEARSHIYGIRNTIIGGSYDTLILHPGATKNLIQGVGFQGQYALIDSTHSSIQMGNYDWDHEGTPAGNGQLQIWNIYGTTGYTHLNLLNPAENGTLVNPATVKIRFGVYPSHFYGSSYIQSESPMNDEQGGTSLVFKTHPYGWGDTEGSMNTVLRLDYNNNATFGGNINTSGAINYVPDNSGGGNDTYTATEVGFVFTVGKVITFHPLTLNTGACTLNINGGGAIAIKTQANGDPANSDMVATGYYPLCWNGSNWVLMTK